MDGFIWRKSAEHNFEENLALAMRAMIERYSLRPRECWVSMDEHVGAVVTAAPWARRNGLAIVPKHFVKRGYFFIGG